MKQVVFKTLTGDGTIKKLGTARMVKGKVKFSFVEKRVQKELELDRIVINGQVYTPKDGSDYLIMLPVEFSGSRLWAEVEEA